MYFSALRAKDLILWAIGVSVVFMGLGVGLGRLVERAGMDPQNASAENAFELSVVKDKDETASRDDFSLEVLSVSASRRTKYSIYIYHTHTCEAYEPTKENPYKSTQQWRTADEAHNVVRVGDELTTLLVSAGFSVFHDRTAYELPNLSTAYARSLSALETTVLSGVPYDLYIDLHRDSYSAGNGANTVTVGTAQGARLMFLIGQGTGSALDEKPDWESNLRIADALKAHINAAYDGLCRDTKLKAGRYNQHIAPACVLLEVGNNKNTLEEALVSMPPLANAVCAYFDSL